ncbi:MAG: DUF3179 domain-containing protein [Planctomycetes bacterium]|nr:DUF3179 domain-containing protein [Planctomycetota bacterium]
MTQPHPDIRTTRSPEGHRRKEAIRAAACKAAADRRRGARFLTTVAVAALPLVLGVAIWSQLPAGGALAPENERVFTQGNPDAHGDSIMGDSRLTEAVREDGTSRYRNLRFETIHDWPPVAVNTIDDDELLEFDVSGFLYESNVLLYDHQHRGLWSQLGFAAISGPHAGRRLWHINNWELTTYDTWCAKYPDSTVVSVEGSGGRSRYASYMRNNRILFPVSRHDDRLADKTPVIGVRNRGIARAYPVEHLLAAGLILDEIAGEPVVLRASADGSISVDEAPRDAFVAHAFWFAWYAQHPDTDVY